MDNLSQTDVILWKYRFIPHNFRRDAWWNLWSSGSYGVSWQSKQNGAAADVSAEIVSYSYFYWKKYDCNWVTKLRSRYYCNMSRISPRLIRCHWSFDPRWVKISGHSEQLGPCGSTSHFVNNRHSKVKTRGASCIGGFGQTDGRRKFELGIPQSRGASYIRGASSIRDKTVFLVPTSTTRFAVWWGIQNGQNIIWLYKDNFFYEQWHLIP